MKWLVTTHAVERLMGRCNRTLTPLQAEALLVSQLPSSVKLDRLTRRGHGLYQITTEGFPMLVIGKPDPTIRRMVAVSVLRVDEEEETGDATNEVLAAYERAQKRPAAVPFMPVSDGCMKPIGDMKPGIKIDLLQRRIAALEEHVAKLQLAEARVEEGRDMVALERRYVECQLRELAKGGPEAPTARLQRAIEHGEKMSRERDELRLLLREAIRAVREVADDGHPIACDALASLSNKAPRFTAPTFLYPDRFTREERQAAARVAEDAPDRMVPA